MKIDSFFPALLRSLSLLPESGAITSAQRKRLLTIFVLLLFWASLLSARLVWLQVFRHREFVQRASRQQERRFEVAPLRGFIYDRNLDELAMTEMAGSIYVVPPEIMDRVETATLLSKALHNNPDASSSSEQEIMARLNSSRNFAWITRKQDASTINRIMALQLRGVYVQKEFKRWYPDNQIAAQVLGSVGLDDEGLAGIEWAFDEDLHGAPGHMLEALDAHGHVLGSVEREPLPGENFVLTIDEDIQFMVEQALSRTIERTKAVSGAAIVQDPHTGQVLALAVRPTFDPNDLRHATMSSLRNVAVSDVYEPRSIFRLVTYAAALEEHVTQPGAKIDCQGGKIVVAGHTIRDDHYNGVLTTSQAFSSSSNVAAIKLALRLGSDDLYKRIRSFGFGERSGIELPGETRGLLKPPEHWTTLTLESVSIGHEIGITPLQLIGVVSTIANGGVYLPPSIVVERTDQVKGSPKLHPATFRPNRDLPNPLPEGAHRVISELTSAEVRKMVEGMLPRDTRLNADANEHSVAVMTGTAQKFDATTLRYSETNYVVSTIGFAPVYNPVVSVLMVLDSPRVSRHKSSKVSELAFHELAQEILEYLGVPQGDISIHDKAPLNPITSAVGVHRSPSN